MIAVEYRRMGRDELAQKHLDLRGDGQVSIADPLLEQISEVSGGASLLVNRGVAASEAGDLLKARRLFEEALALEPDNAPARLNLGVTLVGLGLPDEARQELELARDRAPENPRVHFNLGTLLSAGGETSQAIDAYRAAIRLDPGYIAAIFNLANAHLRVGDYPSAIDEYRRVIEDQPSNAGARVGEVVALTLAGRERDALASVEESLRRAPDDPGLLQAHARLLATASAAELRDGEQAHQIALQLMSQQRVLAHVETLAMALAELGDFEGAVRWQRAAGEAVRASGREDLLPFVTANLARYEAGLPCRRAWDPAGL